MLPSQQLTADQSPNWHRGFSKDPFPAIIHK
jgi:hypothetical protein